MNRFSSSCAAIGAALALASIMVGLARACDSYPPEVSLEAIEERINDSIPEHPRLLVADGQLRELAATLDRDPLRQRVAALVVRTADALADVPPIERKLAGRRLLGQSRRCIQRVLTLAMAFHLTGQQRYVDRCREEMLAISRFDDWNPDHFLDVAEMTFGMAIGYDWLYDQLDEEARRAIRAAIVEKGVALPFETKHNRWVQAKNNWGQVCHGGLTAGALAVMEDEPELAARTVHNALKNVVVSMAAYAPKGSYPEGPGYWVYGTSYNAWLIAMLNRVFGDDFGLTNAPGFAETGAYPAIVSGPSGLFFNYADGGAGRGPQAVMFWFAAEFGHPEWLHGERALWQRLVARSPSPPPDALDRFLPLALLWMDQAPRQDGAPLPLSWSSKGKVPITIHRSSWTDPDATFVGLKAGSPQAPHGQMDAGSFVLDCDGVRWGVDLGAEGYHAIEARGMSLWSAAQDSDRWTIFRQSNLGHNTLVIDDQLQVAAGDATFVAFSDDPSHAHSIVNLTPVYRGQAASARRGVALLPSGEVLIQDELSGLKPGSRVRWGMITPGKLSQPIEKQSASIQLEQAEKRLELTRLAPSAIEWKEIDTATPRNPWDSPNRGTRMVALEAVAPASGELTLAVIATPGSCQAPERGDAKVRPLEQWGGE